MRENDDPAEVRRTIRHIAMVAGHFKGKDAEWDVVNEPMSETGRPDQDTLVSLSCREPRMQGSLLPRRTRHYGPSFRVEEERQTGGIARFTLGGRVAASKTERPVRASWCACTPDCRNGRHRARRAEDWTWTNNDASRERGSRRRRSGRHARRPRRRS
ncbi:endo-1,4-beta-xylanase [Streptomyces sp. NPDC055056]